MYCYLLINILISEYQITTQPQPPPPGQPPSPHSVPGFTYYIVSLHDPEGVKHILCLLQVHQSVVFLILKKIIIISHIRGLRIRIRSKLDFRGSNPYLVFS